MALDRMTLDQFTREVGNRLEAFDRATKNAQGEGVDGFVGDRFERRTFDDWMQEFEAFEGLIVAAKSVIADRTKSIKLVNRR